MKGGFLCESKNSYLITGSRGICSSSEDHPSRALLTQEIPQESLFFFSLYLDFRVY